MTNAYLLARMIKLLMGDNSYTKTEMTETLGSRCHRCDGDRNYKQDLRQPCDTCLRALSPLPKEGTWYSKFMGVPIREGKCDYYWRVE